MGKLYVFMGKSAVGKDTLFARVLEKHKELRHIIPYTTRPIRKGEVEGDAYHFVSIPQMEQMQKAKKIAEIRCYDTVNGPWYYFTADDGQIDFTKENSCIISTLEGFESLREYFGKEKVVPIYIQVPDFVRLNRSLEREKGQKEPCVAEVCRRFLADEEDFSDEKLKKAGIEGGILNINLEEAIKDIEKVLEL